MQAIYFLFFGMQIYKKILACSCIENHFLFLGSKFLTKLKIVNNSAIYIYKFHLLKMLLINKHVLTTTLSKMENVYWWS